MKVLLALLLAAQILWTQQSLAQPPTCALTLLPEHGELELWNPLNKWRDGIPSHHDKINKPLDNLDIALMLNSFSHKTNGQAVESGVVEILDSNGHTLYASEILTGSVGQIDMRSALAEGLNRLPLFREARTLRYRHTHPPALKGHDVTYNTWKFSQADVNVNEGLRKVMDKHPNISHISLEAIIIYLDPQLVRFSSTTDVFREYGRTKGYRIDSK